MRDTRMLLVDAESGVVRAQCRSSDGANSAAVGRLCHEFVAGPACAPGCARALVASEHRDEVRQEVTCGSSSRQVTCVSVGSAVLIASELSASEAPSTNAPKLTERERQVLHLVSEGYSNREIARILRVHHATVRTHVENVRGKLEAKTRVEAVARAVAWRLIEPAV